MRKKEIIILIVLGALILAAGTAVLIAHVCNQPQVIVGEFVPLNFDENALPGTPAESLEHVGYGTLNLNEQATVSMCANVLVQDSAAQVYFTSLTENAAWLRLQLMDEKGNLLGQTGLLRPGTYVEEVSLTAVPKKTGLVMARILIYEPETYFSLGSASVQVMLICEK
jgi:hypothetical protein